MGRGWYVEESVGGQDGERGGEVCGVGKKCVRIHEFFRLGGKDGGIMFVAHLCLRESVIMERCL